MCVKLVIELSENSLQEALLVFLVGQHYVSKVLGGWGDSVALNGNSYGYTGVPNLHSQ